MAEAGVVPAGWAELNLRSQRVVSSYWRGPPDGHSTGRVRRPVPPGLRLGAAGQLRRTRRGFARRRRGSLPEPNQSTADEPDQSLGLHYGLLASLLLARGVPMLRAGDVLTQGAEPRTATIRQLIELRWRRPAVWSPGTGEPPRWLGPNGAPLDQQDWDGLTAFAMHVAQDQTSHVLVCLNPGPDEVTFVLPSPAGAGRTCPGGRWRGTSRSGRGRPGFSKVRPLPLLPCHGAAGAWPATSSS